MRKLIVEPRFEILPTGEQGDLVAFGVGPDESIYITFSLNKPDTKVEQPGWATFFKTKPDMAQSYKIKRWSQSLEATEIFVARDEFNITKVQPLGDDVILVCPRCVRKADNEIELNGRVFGPDGRLKRAFVLGDGIQQVQTAADGTIWVSYFDEGIFGNYGWREPIGASGLVHWSAYGEKLGQFEPEKGLDYMADCYAMTLDSADDVWCCYYTEFPLVQLRNGKVFGAWNVPVRGSEWLAVEPPYALFLGSYDDKQELKLLELLGDGKTKVVETYLACSTDGETLAIDRVATRGGTIHLVSGRSKYAVDIDMCLRAG
jgi:hypothetical protein